VTGTHMIVLPGRGYAAYAEHEAEPIANWLCGLGIQASVFRYPLNVRHPVPLDALRGEIRRRRASGADRIGLIGFSAGGHLAGLAALAPGAGPADAVQFAVLGYAITSRTGPPWPRAIRQSGVSGEPGGTQPGPPRASRC
jgi:acetyl esterase/lipase